MPTEYTEKKLKKEEGLNILCLRQRANKRLPDSFLRALHAGYDPGDLIPRFGAGRCSTKNKIEVIDTMEFIPAGEIIGQAHQVRSVSIKESPHLPDGEYSFIDTYCADPECDCRKTMIQVLCNGKLVSVINYGWESATFYENWMGSSSKDNSMPRMHDATIDITSPDLVSRDGILGLFNALLNDIWIAKFKCHYNEFKAAISKKSKSGRALGRKKRR